MSRIAGICNDAGRIAARSGCGAVMGSKKLKAIVLAGSKPIQVDNFEEVKNISKKLGTKLKKANAPAILKGNMIWMAGLALDKASMQLPLDGILLAMLFKKWGTPLNTPMGIYSGDAPIKNWGGSVKDFPGKENKVFNPDYIISREFKKYHCYSCGMGCGGICTLKGIKDCEFPETHKPEYETIQAFGGLLLCNNVDSIFYINELLNRAGMDSISAGNTVAFAIECYENGLITKEDTNGLELNWSNSEAVVKLVKMMINREGIGDILADGSRVAARKIGKDSEKFAMNIGGSEPGMHDSRYDPQLAIHFVTEPAPGKHTIGMELGYGTMNLADICTWAPVVKLSRKKFEYVPSLEMSMRAVATSCYSMLTDGAGGCMYAQMFGTQHWNPCNYLNAAVGWNRSGDDYMEIGKRIQTTRQLFNIKHGIDPTKVKLPKRMQGVPPLDKGPLKGKSLETDQMVEYYFEGFKWDKKTGIPTKEVIEELGLNVFLAEGGVNNG